MCPKCAKNPAIIHSKFGVMPCNSCVNKDRKTVGKISEPPEFATETMNDRIQSDRLKHEGDILQPWDGQGKPNPEFVKVYPDKATEYFNREQLESL